MKKLLISAALIGLVAAAAPASAQYQNDRYGQGYGQQGYGYDSGYRGGDVRARIQRIDVRIDRLAQNGRISRREAVRLGQEVDRLRYLEQRYARNGLTRWEQDDLQRRVYALQQQVREDRRDGRGYSDRDDRYGDRYDDRRYDDRRYDRDDD